MSNVKPTRNRNRKSLTHRISPSIKSHVAEFTRAASDIFSNFLGLAKAHGFIDLLYVLTGFTYHHFFDMKFENG